MPLARDIDLRRIQSLPDHLQAEGSPWFSSVNVLNGTITTNQVVGSFVFPGVTKALWVENIVVSSNRQVDIQVSIGGTYTGVQGLHRVVLNPGVAVTIPVRQLVRPSIAAEGNTGWGEVRIRTVLDATPTGAYVIGTASGTAVYDDLNYGADKVMLVVGDSILNGTVGVTDKKYSMEWLTRDYFRSRGVNLRVINKAVSGSTSGDHERFRAHGLYDLPQVDYLHYQLGTNDAGAGVSSATYKANVAAMIAFKKAVYPNAQMVVWGPTPRQNSTYETALIAMRTAAQEAVTEAASSKVRYASLATAFDRTVEANFAASDTSGDKVHPSNASHAAAYGLIQTALNGWNMSTLI